MESSKSRRATLRKLLSMGQASTQGELCRMLAERGIREYVSSVQDDNLPALSYAYGGRQRLVERVDLLSYLCLLGFRRIWIECDMLPRLEQRLTQAGLLPGAPS